MDLTVGKLEELIRPFSKGTNIELSCGCCHHSSIGSEYILKLKDNTNQTYGYINLEFNATSDGSVELNKDKEEWYKAEINKLKEQIEIKDELITEYDNVLKSLKRTIDFNMQWFETRKKE